MSLAKIENSLPEVDQDSQNLKQALVGLKLPEATQSQETYCKTQGDVPEYVVVARLQQRLERTTFYKDLDAAEAGQKFLEAGPGKVFFSSAHAYDVFLPNVSEALRIAKETYDDSPQSEKKVVAEHMRKLLEPKVTWLRDYSILASKNGADTSSYSKVNFDDLATLELSPKDLQSVMGQLGRSLKAVDRWADSYILGVSGETGTHSEITPRSGSWSREMDDLLLNAKRLIDARGSNHEAKRDAVKKIVGERLREMKDYAQEGHEKYGHSLKAIELFQEKFDKL